MKFKWKIFVNDDQHYYCGHTLLPLQTAETLFKLIIPLGFYLYT